MLSISNIVELLLICIFLTVYVWALYNIPILVAGVKNLCNNRQKNQGKKLSKKSLPKFSIVVPVKNEEKVIGRLLAALSKLSYPIDKKEIIIVEDGSTDRTLDICLRYARENVGIRILHKPISNGKPSALNYAIKHAKGEIIGVFDADNVPAQNALLKACRYFEDLTVAAIQGQTLSINPKENMLTQFMSYEEAVWCEAYLRGKDVLKLFVHLKGSGQFIRRDVLEKLKGFDENVLSEDMEISAKLTENNFKIKYASDVRTWQESPCDLKTLFKQRTRWFRGTMEVAFRYGKLMAKPDRKRIDAEATLLGPFMLIASLMPYLAVFFAFFTVFPFNILWQATVQFATLTTSLTIFVSGLALIYISKPRRIKSVLWLPFIYFYWSLQAFIALYAALLILLRRPGKWVKTEKKGVIANPALVLDE